MRECPYAPLRTVRKSHINQGYIWRCKSMLLTRHDAASTSRLAVVPHILLLIGESLQFVPPSRYAPVTGPHHRVSLRPAQLPSHIISALTQPRPPPPPSHFPEAASPLQVPASTFPPPPKQNQVMDHTYPKGCGPPHTSPISRTPPPPFVPCSPAMLSLFSSQPLQLVNM